MAWIIKDYEVGKTYNFQWPDGAIAEFVIESVDYKGFQRFNIRYANGSPDSFEVNSNMYKKSYPKV